MSAERDAMRWRLVERAYRAAKPSDEEVEAGVRRALGRLRRSQQRRRSRLVPIVAIAVLALGTLAYAKPGGVATVLSTLMEAVRIRRASPSLQAPLPRSRAEEEAPLPRSEASSVPGERAAPERAALETMSEAPPVAPERAKVAEREAASPASRNKEKTAQSAEPKSLEPGWAAVKSALDAGDTERAFQALHQLGKSESPKTRAKAAFGRAQLLWARGDSDAACRIAESLSNAPDIDERTRQRANALIANCPR